MWRAPRAKRCWWGVCKHAHTAFNPPGIDKDIYITRDAAEYAGCAIQHEFKYQLAERLTDTKWREMLTAAGDAAAASGERNALRQGK